MFSRGYPHIHGMTWCNMEELEKDYKGLKRTFEKLKQREELYQEDITPLQQFVEANITCSTDIEELKKLLQPKGHDDNMEEGECFNNCDPEKCDICCEYCAELIRQRALETNTHHHTKTCRKHGPDCRFGFPRPPSGYTIIAQAMSKEVIKTEDETVKSLDYIM